MFQFLANPDSFFGTQEGDFSLTVSSIRAVKLESSARVYTDKSHDGKQRVELKEKSGNVSNDSDNSKQGIFSRLMGACVVS